jgi:hypothetical protein
MKREVVLVQTCGACPEQYDVFLDTREGFQLGYLRLRHGGFRADYGGSGGLTVYYANPNGDGIFEEDERDFYLREAISALLCEYDSYEHPESRYDFEYTIFGDD